MIFNGYGNWTCDTKKHSNWTNVQVTPRDHKKCYVLILSLYVLLSTLHVITMYTYVVMCVQCTHMWCYVNRYVVLFVHMWYYMYIYVVFITHVMLYVCTHMPYYVYIYVVLCAC